MSSTMLCANLQRTRISFSKISSPIHQRTSPSELKSSKTPSSVDSPWSFYSALRFSAASYFLISRTRRHRLSLSARPILSTCHIEPQSRPLARHNFPNTLQRLNHLETVGDTCFWSSIRRKLSECRSSKESPPSRKISSSSAQIRNSFRCAVAGNRCSRGIF